MDTSIVIAIVATVLTAGVAAATAIFQLRSDFKAQRDLTRLMAEPDHSASLHRLQQERAALAKAPPDRSKLEDATEVVQTLAGQLPRRKKRAVLAHLRQDSEASVATYVVGLIDKAEHRRSALENGAST